MMSKPRIAFVVLSLLLMMQPVKSPAAELLVYFGTQATTPGVGFSLSHFNTETGALTKPQLICPADAPSFFVIHPDGQRLYTTNFSGVGGVSAYRIDPKTGALELINRIPGGNAGTSYMNLDRTGKFALAANYDSGHIATFAINPDGSLGQRIAYDKHTGSSVNPQRQGKTYPHCIITDSTNRFALVPDLGLDKLFIYRFDEKTGALAANNPPFVAVTPGAGPRHVRFHPNQKWAYLLCEMGSLVVGFHWDSARGALAEFQTVSLIPDSFKGENNSAELEVHPNGRFLYASNRGHDSIAVFAIDQTDGKLTLIEHVPTQGKNPRNFALDPSAKWMICTNQASNSAVVFRVDDSTGRLTQVGDPVEVPAPCCERFLPVAP
jgi:6-phosphogluconolactonase